MIYHIKLYIHIHIYQGEREMVIERKVCYLSKNNNLHSDKTCGFSKLIFQINSFAFPNQWGMLYYLVNGIKKQNKTTTRNNQGMWKQSLPTS